MKQLEGIVLQEQKVLAEAASGTRANCTHSLEVEIESWNSASILLFMQHRTQTQEVCHIELAGFPTSIHLN